MTTTLGALDPERAATAGSSQAFQEPVTDRRTGATQPGVVIVVIVPGATSVNPASRTATASPRSAASHSRAHAPESGGPHGVRRHGGRARAAAASSIDACPTCAAALPTVIPSAPFTQITGTPRGRRAGLVVGQVRAADLQPGDDLRHVVDRAGQQRAGLRVADVDRHARQLLHRRPVRAARPAGDLADARVDPASRRPRATPRPARPADRGTRRARRGPRPPAPGSGGRVAAPAAARPASRARRRPAPAGSPRGAPRARSRRSARRAARARSRPPLTRSAPAAAGPRPRRRAPPRRG